MIIEMLIVIIGLASVIGGVDTGDIFYVMDIWYTPEMYDTQYMKITLILVDFDIPDKLGYYSPLNNAIVLEMNALQPARLLPNGNCNNNLWHEILHVKWGTGYEGEDHVRMVKEGHCA